MDQGFPDAPMEQSSGLWHCFAVQSTERQVSRHPGFDEGKFKKLRFRSITSRKGTPI